MSLDDSMALVTERLKKWSLLPKYALERRIDVLLTPFLEDFLKANLPASEIELIVPEFPILSVAATSAEKSDPPRLDEKLSALSINADYLFFGKDAGGEFGLILELKTDQDSFSDKQLKSYLTARRWGMTRLVEHVGFIRERAKRKKEKYETLLKSLGEKRSFIAPIKIAYLGPSNLKKQAAGADWFLDLHDFRTQPIEQIAVQHRALWRLVAEILANAK